MIFTFMNFIIYSFMHFKNSGCSSVRLEYTSGGRVAAGSNPVIPTTIAQYALYWAFFYVVVPFPIPESSSIRHGIIIFYKILYFPFPLFWKNKKNMGIQ